MWGSADHRVAVTAATVWVPEPSLETHAAESGWAGDAVVGLGGRDTSKEGCQGAHRVVKDWILKQAG